MIPIVLSLAPLPAEIVKAFILQTPGVPEFEMVAGKRDVGRGAQGGRGAGGRDPRRLHLPAGDHRRDRGGGAGG